MSLFEYIINVRMNQEKVLKNGKTEKRPPASGDAIKEPIFSSFSHVKGGDSPAS